MKYFYWVTFLFIESSFWGWHVSTIFCNLFYVYLFLGKTTYYFLKKIPLTENVSEKHISNTSSGVLCTICGCCHQKLCHIFFDWQHLWWIHRLYTGMVDRFYFQLYNITTMVCISTRFESQNLSLYPLQYQSFTINFLENPIQCCSV